MAGLKIATEPNQEPISLQEAKDYLRVENSTNERIIQAMIETARRFAEEHLGRSLMQQTIHQFIDGYDEMEDPLFEGFRKGPFLTYYKNYITLARPPVQSITSVSTFNDSDAETTFASTKYYLDNVREPARVVLRNGETFPTSLRALTRTSSRPSLGSLWGRRAPTRHYIATSGSRAHGWRSSKAASASYFFRRKTSARCTARYG